MQIDRSERVIRLSRQTPVLEGTGAERGLPFDNGRYIVHAHVLNGRGIPTGKMQRIASFASRDLANACRDRINAQNQNFQAQIETDTRTCEQDTLLTYLQRDWPGATSIQQGPYYVAASYLDEFGRYAGSGAVSWFADEASAIACAETLNTENPAHEAEVVKDESYREAA